MTNREKAGIDQLITTYRDQFSPDVEAGLSRLHASMANQDEANAALAPKAKQRPLWLRVAAVGLLLITATAVYFQLTNSDVQHYTTTDQTLAFALPDGTEVLLNQHSSLTVLTDYGQEERAIQLEGEAFFEVVPDSEHPFMVRQGDLALKVVGTSFNLIATPQDDFFEVEVATGKVELRKGNEQIGVAAKQCGRFKPQTGLERMDAPNLNRQAWFTKTLIFQSTPFSEVIEHIERTYGIAVLTKDRYFANCDFPVTATFTDLPLLEVLEQLTPLAGQPFHWNKIQQGYELKQGCK